MEKIRLKYIFYVANSSYSQAPTVQQQQQHESRAQKITKRALRQQEFLRSASARIPRKVDGPVTPDESDKKREESMKRLLEWKQRMLQSPLTRKIASQTSTLPLENRHSAIEGSTKSNIHRAKSDIIKKDDCYNSYSSDDEGEYEFYHFTGLLSFFTVFCHRITFFRICMHLIL